MIHLLTVLCTSPFHPGHHQWSFICAVTALVPVRGGDCFPLLQLLRIHSSVPLLPLQWRAVCELVCADALMTATAFGLLSASMSSLNSSWCFIGFPAVKSNPLLCQRGPKTWTTPKVYFCFFSRLPWRALTSALCALTLCLLLLWWPAFLFHQGTLPSSVGPLTHRVRSGFERSSEKAQEMVEASAFERWYSNVGLQVLSVQ